VVSTTVGYAGGESRDPDYRHIGDHSETVQVIYDPRQISYAELLEVFWNEHDPHLATHLRQYRSAIFYSDEEQHREAERSRDALASERGQRIFTAIEPAGTFYPAEDYHQKYLLRNTGELLQAFRSIYPEERQLVASTAAARVNGYLGCNGEREELQENLHRLGLSPAQQELLVRYVSTSCQNFVGVSCAAPPPR